MSATKIDGSEDRSQRTAVSAAAEASEVTTSDQLSDTIVSVPQTQERANEEPFRTKVQLAVIVAVLSFGGSIGGTLLSGVIGDNRWERETTFALRKETFAKRAELL